MLVHSSKNENKWLMAKVNLIFQIHGNEDKKSENKGTFLRE